ncbi:uncharacterized protein P884DRAFT_333100 [Thermothelomyces heterothallicus CBS 202.75]|uniref:uncharacterized protein n=1 Tax=Thermothelomyces heterothallicus CBS 202.75 TaxID=1149848 RepID=UPI0037425606
MHLSSWGLWPFLASLVYLGAVADPAGVLEVDLVFPRNETYAPTPYMPIVFGFRNGELARRLNPEILVTMRNSTALGDISSYIETPVTVNWTSNEPNFVYTVFQNEFAIEGTWWIAWDVWWTTCKVEDDGLIHGDITRNHSSRLSDFVIKKGGKAVDLVAITANDKTCPETLGITINVTDTTAPISFANQPVPLRVSYPRLETCALVASSTPTANPCLVRIDSTAAAAISASAKSRQCILDRTPDCPDRWKKNTAQQLAVAGAASFAAALGAFGFLLLA